MLKDIGRQNVLKGNDVIRPHVARGQNDFSNEVKV